MESSELQALGARFGMPELSERLRHALARSADPERAPHRAADVLGSVAAAHRGKLAQVWKHDPAALERVLTACCGAAPFLAARLARHPEWLLQLVEENFAAPRDRAVYERRLGRHLTGVSDANRPDALRRFKYYELTRITVRDLSPDIVPDERVGETLAELTDLADVLLAESHALAAARMTRAHGAACWTTPDARKVALRFVVLGLGKLGARLLNYSSDVDLIYVFESLRDTRTGRAGPVRPAGKAGLTPVEYFTRLAQEFGRIVAASTAEGFLYRIDLDLRPEGSRAPLVCSSTALAQYYEVSAAPWEKIAFMKARAIAGDFPLGRQLIREMRPVLYRSTMDYGSVAAIREIKDKIKRAKQRAGGTFDVKIGAGGIRDVEFVAQAVQLLYGGRIPEVRGGSTDCVLVSLSQVGLLPDADVRDLLAAYRFLRRVENRLQMVAERQTHRLPGSAKERERIARGMGFRDGTAVAQFESVLDAHRRRIRAIFDELFPAAASDRILVLFRRNARQLMKDSVTARMIGNLAEQFAGAIGSSANPERAMNNLDRFIQGVGQRSFYYELLLDRPELVGRLAALFAASEYLSEYFARQPRLIEPIFNDPNVLLLRRGELENDYEAIRADLEGHGKRDDLDLELGALRLFHHRAVLNVGLLDLDGKVSLAEAGKSLADIAEVCLDKSLSLARAQMGKGGPRPPADAESGDFLVVGMGKLGSWELTYGSDLDVIFLYDAGETDDAALLAAQEFFVRLAQKLIFGLQAHTRDGVCYEIDARLRPSGNQGMLVTSLSAFRQYHHGSAQVWERQALLRARGVAGSEPLARTFDGCRREILRRALPGNVGEELHRLRLRVATELARETNRRHDIKLGRGGMTDVESVVQFLQLKHGGTHEELLDVAPLATMLGRVERLGLLPEAQTLQEGWTFFQRLSSRLRIAENRSISDLDEERGDLEGLAKSLGYTSPQRSGGAKRALLDAYRRHSEAVRRIYLATLGVE